MLLLYNDNDKYYRQKDETQPLYLKSTNSDK